MEAQKEFDLKIVLIGDAASGKTTFIEKIISGEFNEKIDPTIGASYFKYFFLIESYKIKLNIWDTSGNPKYSSLV